MDHPRRRRRRHPTTLRRWSDAEPAIVRIRHGRGFGYRTPDGERLTDADAQRRIRALAIPPAWSDVRISPRADTHLQATGRDARGRKQYRYHPAFRRARDERKFADLVAFGLALPSLRRRVRRDLAGRDLGLRRIVALVVRLLDRTAMRVGNDAYRRANGSFGLTTLRRRHVRLRGDRIELRYRGKGGAWQEARLEDAPAAKVLRQLLATPGPGLLASVDDDGRRRPVRSADVNEYLRDGLGHDATAKMFRTWAATVLACRAMVDAEPDRSGRSAGRGRVSAPAKEALAVVADHLGNTSTVARQAYVHPAVIEAGAAVRARAQARPRRTRRAARTGLSADERLTLAVLRAAGPARTSAGSASPGGSATGHDRGSRQIR